MSGTEEKKRDAIPVTVRIENGDLVLRFDQAWRILGLNQDLIRSADQKIYLLIVMSTLLVSYVATNLDRIIRLGMLQNGLLVVFIAVSGGFFYYALSTLFPRRQLNDSVNEKLIFFGDIALRPNPESYIADIGRVPMENLFEDLARQIYLVSQVATQKYIAYHRAWQAILAEVALFVLLEFSMAIV